MGRPARRRSRVILAALAVAAVVSVAGCGTGGVSAGGSADPTRGKELFTGEGQCAGCHALRDAGSKSTVGPDLDASFGPAREEGFKESTIREIVRQQVQYPLDEKASPEVPPMPADLVEGEDLEAVAAYVAQCAGNTDEALCPGPGGEDGQAAGTNATDGESIFASAGCGSCHALEKAGSSGQVGPNLDDSQTPLREAIAQIANGGGGMPAYKGRLDEKQIRAVAEYVSGSAKK